MTGRRRPWWMCFLAIALLASPAMAAEGAEAQENLFPNAEFKGSQIPAAWLPESKDRPWEKDAFSMVTEDGRTFARATKAVAIMKQERPIDPAWKTVQLLVDVRRAGVKKGGNDWDVPFTEVDFNDAAGKSLLPWTKSIWMPTDSNGWETITKDYPVPEGAETMVVRIGFKAAAGTVDFANVRVVAKETRPESEAAAARQAAADKKWQAEEAEAAKIAAVARKTEERRAAERKPINGWVRPEFKPVKMDKPLDPPPVTGKKYYVATTGDNANDGSEGKPWKSIQHGMNQLQPGDCLYIRGGEYRENMITFARSGKPDAYITVAGYPGEQAKVINSGGMAVFNLDAGSPWTPKRLDELAYVVIRDLYIDAVKGNQAIRITGPMMLPEFGNDVVKARNIRHNIWVVNCDIVGGGPAEGGLGVGYGAHDCVLSNNRVYNNTSGMMSFLYSDGTIIEWNTVHNTSSDQDDGGAIKSMAPGVIIRYNTVHANNRSPTSKKPGWAPDSEGGGQWRFLQGVTGIYLDWAQVTPKGGNNYYPEGFQPVDAANYVYGNTVYDNNAGIFAFISNNAQIFDNVIYGNGRMTTGGWAEGTEGGKWLEFIGPAGYGIAVTKSTNVKVYDNIVYENQKGGLTTESVPEFQGIFNVLYGNDLAQIHVRQGDDVVFGFNRVLAVEKQGAPFRRGDQNFPTPEAFREKYPYQDHGTEVVPVPSGKKPLEAAKAMVTDRPASENAWREAHAQLVAKAQAVGVGVPPATVPQAAYDPTRSLQAPLPWRIPGVVEFENYDVGGPEVSFKDNEAENQGGHYRKDAVDVKASPSGGNGAVVGFTQSGEWMEYTINTAKAGDYVLTIAYATPESGRRIRLSLDDKPLGGPISLGTTSGWDDLQTMEAGKVSIPAGDGVLRVTIEAGPVDLDRLQLLPAN